MTGGIGRTKLSHFYRHNFIFNNSADTELELISRIMGIDRIVDEFIFKFTHDQMIDWYAVPTEHSRVNSAHEARFQQQSQNSPLFQYMYEIIVLGRFANEYLSRMYVYLTSESLFPWDPVSRLGILS